MNSQVVQILQRELGRRCRLNPRYSLRAFARALEISPANLSLILNRRRSPSKRTIELVLEKLELKASEREAIAGREALKISAEENIDLRTFEQISSWLAYAILSLIKTKGFRADPNWVAKRLGVTAHEVKAVVQSLEAAGILKISKQTSSDLSYPRAQIKWIRTKTSLRLNNPNSTALTRAFQRQLISRALESMENDPSEARDISSITFAMSADKMAQAKEEIRQFRLRMAALFEEEGSSTDVYNLTVQMVPVTKGEK